MNETLICALEEARTASATTAFGVWLGECVGARALVCAASSAEDVAAVAAEHRARLVVAAGSSRQGTQHHALQLLRSFAGSVVVLPSEALELWLDPPEARRRGRAVIVAGSDGSPTSLEAAGAAGRIAAGLGGSALIAHAESRVGGGTPASSAVHEPDPIAESDLGLRRSLLVPAVEAARAQGASAEARLLSGDVVTALADLAACESSPLIAIGAGRPNLDWAALADSVTVDMLARATSPVLVAAGEPAMAAGGSDSEPVLAMSRAQALRDTAETPAYTPPGA